MLIRSLRRFLRLKPRFYQARQKLYAAVNSGLIKEGAPLRESVPEIEKIVGWDSRFDGEDWVELVAWAEELNLKLEEVRDFIVLLEILDSRYES